MNENLYNEDYIKGMKFLLNKSKEEGINIRKAQWIPNVSKMLSEHGLCYKFWYNVWYQNRLNRVLLCNTWYDIMYVPSKWLVTWAVTKEGINFWETHLWEMLGLDLGYAGSVNYSEKLQGMKLK